MLRLTQPHFADDGSLDLGGAVEPITALRFGRYSREDNALAVVRLWRSIYASPALRKV